MHSGDGTAAPSPTPIAPNSAVTGSDSPNVPEDSLLPNSKENHSA